MTASPGAIGWHDLTVPDAVKVSDFYHKVCGWTAQPIDMGGYSDYAMNAADGTTLAGVCHARGPNADVPPQWLMYVSVLDLARSVDQVKKSGGKVLREPTSMGGYGTMAIIQDPAGAVLAIFQPPAA